MDLGKVFRGSLSSSGGFLMLKFDNTGAVEKPKRGSGF
jgi:hypothetical protein